MTAVWKYPFPIAKSFTLAMPFGAKPLAIQAQNEQPTLWALVDPRAALETREFTVVGTGHEFDARHFTFIGTLQTPPFVWHIFERTL